VIVIRTVKVNRHYLQALAMLIAAIISVSAFIVSLYHATPPAYYKYHSHISSSGIALHLIQTTPEHIRLQAIADNLLHLSYPGINGGFFWEGNLLSIAVMNDIPAKGVPGEFGSGWYNASYKRGTLVWDAAEQRYSIQVVDTTQDLVIANRRNYWAQGGVSMNLGNEAVWHDQAIAEHMPAIDEEHMRSAIAYDNQNRTWLVVTPTLCTIASFRTAILETLGPEGIVDGVFLDGDGSSQLRAAHQVLPGDKREVFQLIRLVP
jgi:hypothetical protein